MSDMHALMQAQPIPSQQRQAALLLHALHPDDQAWLLSQLDAQATQELSALLQELQSLGIPSDTKLATEATTPAQTPASLLSPAGPELPPATPPIADTPYARLQRLDPLTTPTQWPWLVSYFRHEPALLCARLLELSPWPWQEALLAELDTVRRAQITEQLRAIQHTEDSADAGHTAPRLQAVLLTQLDQFLQPRDDFITQRALMPAQKIRPRSRGTDLLQRLVQSLTSQRVRT